jgi:hypothetical protein
MYGNYPDPTYSSAHRTFYLSQLHRNQQGNIDTAIRYAEEGSGELRGRFEGGCETVAGVLARALLSLERHGESVGQATGDAAADGVHVDEATASEYASLPLINNPPYDGT